MSERSTFSPFWHRVRTMRPRLRPHVEFTRQHYRGGRWHVVHDPTSNAFYRLPPVAHEFVGLFDGVRTVEEVWNLCLTRHGDQAPTQNDAIQLLAQLYGANLLSADTTPETEQLLRRGRQRRQKRWAQQAIGLMYFRVKLFNPDALLSWLEPIARPLLSRVGLALWLVLVLVALAGVVPHWGRLREQFGTALEPANWGWLIAVFVVLKLFHELGHGLICKRLGGSVPEFGAMMLVLVPSPYVDASAAWAFRGKWARVAVGAGGMLFELFLAALAAFLWSATKDRGGLANTLAFNAMLTASVSTVLFNANPLMKFDGYYMLSDLLEVPNLMQRSMAMLKHHFQRWVYRVRGAIAPTSDPGEAAILNLYAVLALAYRVFLFFSITLYLMGTMFGLGLVLAAWTAAMWFVLPTAQFAHWLATSPQLAERRWLGVAKSLAMIALAALLVGAIPMPDHRRASGVVTSEHSRGVFFGTDGFVVSAHKRPGDAVSSGEAILTLESPALVEALREARARLGEAEAIELEATASNPAAAQVARERVLAFRDQVAYFESKLERLVVRAPHDGRVVGTDPASHLGAFVREGQGACEVVDASPDALRVTASLTQTEVLWLNELNPEQYTVGARRVADAREDLPMAPTRIPQAGLRRMAHEALGFKGEGSVETDLSDAAGTTAKRPVFNAEFRFLSGAVEAHPGERVALRFTLPSKPLLAQWVDRLNKLIIGRVRV